MLKNFENTSKKVLYNITSLFFLIFFLTAFLIVNNLIAQEGIRIKDLTEMRGVRVNQLTGIGLVVGLAGTGDSKASIATNKAASFLLSRLGLVVSPNDVLTKNVAVVLVTSELPAFARIGDKLDIRISSVGDAKSLEGGTLVQTTLSAADDQIYATASGTISQGTPMAGAGGDASTQAPKTISLAKAGLVEKEFSNKFIHEGKIELSLRNPDFTTANRLSENINTTFGEFIAEPQNAGLVSVKLPSTVTKNNPSFNPVAFVSVLEQIKVQPDTQAIVVINERTGTIISGALVSIEPVAISHGQLEIMIAKKRARVSELPKTTSVGELVKALNDLGAGPKDVVAILQTLQAAGSLKGTIKIL